MLVSISCLVLIGRLLFALTNKLCVAFDPAIHLGSSNAPDLPSAFSAAFQHSYQFYFYFGPVHHSLIGMGFREKLEGSIERLSNAYPRTVSTYHLVPELNLPPSSQAGQECMLTIAYDQSPSHQSSPERSKALFRYGGKHGTDFLAEDLTSIDRDEWLTDNVISFWEYTLEQRLLAPLKRAKIKLLRPVEAVLLAHGSLENVDDYRKYTHILLPLNPSGGDIAEEGSHWSLLVVSLADGVAFHYNSLHGQPEIAGPITKVLAQLVNKPLRWIEIENVPQQSNSSDCGVFVCMFMEELLEHRLLAVDATHKVSMSLHGFKMNASYCRKRIKRTVEDEWRRDRANTSTQ